MTRQKCNLTLLSSAAGATRTQSIAQRIESRLRLLRRWLQEGIPSGQPVPASLTEARLWHEPMLGILRISSPNEFTQKHPIHGGQVKAISELLTKIRRKYATNKRPGSASKERSVGSQAALDHSEMDRQLVAAVSQWHAERAAHLHQKGLADAAAARERNLLAEADMKDRVISDLRRELANRKVLRVVK
ncbi:hypothetical protein [Bosea beijingensis]